jgi:hypothetical protein
MLVKLVVGLGTALGGGFAQHGDGLGLALIGQVARICDLALSIRRIDVECHLAAFVSQIPAAPPGCIVDILLGLFKQPLAQFDGIRRRQYRLRPGRFRRGADRGVGSDSATTRPKASRPLDITTVRISGGGLSFAGNFGGVTMIVPMRPILASRIASVAPGAAIVQSDTRPAHRGAELGTRGGLWTRPILKRM